MASGFTILLLATVAILPEVKSMDWKVPVAPGEVPFIAVIEPRFGVPNIGALITPNTILGPHRHLYSTKNEFCDVKLGCTSLEDCAIEVIRTYVFYADTIHSLMKIKLPGEIVSSDLISPIAISPSIDYSYPICTYVGLDETSGVIYTTPVAIFDPQSCRDRIVTKNVPRGQACFDDITSTTSHPGTTVGGSIVCNKALVGMMTIRRPLGSKPGPHLMCDLTNLNKRP
ncbi:uncharacterized protein [Fopius arisanus]|uniref:Uncharacterized protein n=1 Tax=Fopius arisanus TaxID=64838 RepID=A0A9R1TEC8_9HYME|nr:PREDICTED: uncharacterized protein LOC105269340 [Fopius arisanus]